MNDPSAAQDLCPRCENALDADAGGACGECGWIPSRYDDSTPSLERKRYEDYLEADAVIEDRYCGG